MAQSSASAFAISIGSQNAIFPSDISDNEEQQREKVKQAAVLIKAAREKATGNLALQTAVDQVGTQMLRKENPTWKKYPFIWKDNFRIYVSTKTPLLT